MRKMWSVVRQLWFPLFASAYMGWMAWTNTLDLPHWFRFTCFVGFWFSGVMTGDVLNGMREQRRARALNRERDEWKRYLH